MRNQRSTRRLGAGRATRAVAGGCVLAAAAALGLPAAAQADRPAAADPGPFDSSQLSKVSDAVLEADVAGTAWHVDEDSRSVVVTADSTVSDSEITGLQRSVGTLSGALRVARTGGRFSPYVSGGDAIRSDGSRCSLGFNVRKGDTFYFLTAGHCTKDRAEWTDDSGARLGPTVGTSFPENDYGLVRHEGSQERPGAVGGQDITRAGEARVGQSVQRRGSTTGTHDGSVTALDATVNYGEGRVVSGLIRTDVCAEPGDSGGPLYSGDVALGLTSGGSGDCSEGGITFYQPVQEPLSRYGVEIY